MKSLATLPVDRRKAQDRPRRHLKSERRKMKILEEKNKSQTQKSSQKGQSLAKLLHCYSRSLAAKAN
jgi:hypothetical protein